MGLIKTGLKAAVAVKTAHVVHDRIQRRQQAQWATGGQPAGTAPPAGAPQAPTHVVPAAAAAPPSASDILTQLTQLGELKATGVLTEAEFATQKARILSG